MWCCMREFIWTGGGITVSAVWFVMRSPLWTVALRMAPSLLARPTQPSTTFCIYLGKKARGSCRMRVRCPAAPSVCRAVSVIRVRVDR